MRNVIRLYLHWQRFELVLVALLVPGLIFESSIANGWVYAGGSFAVPWVTVIGLWCWERCPQGGVASTLVLSWCGVAASCAWSLGWRWSGVACQPQSPLDAPRFPLRAQRRAFAVLTKTANTLFFCFFLLSLRGKRSPTILARAVKGVSCLTFSLDSTSERVWYTGCPLREEKTPSEARSK